MILPTHVCSKRRSYLSPALKWALQRILQPAFKKFMALPIPPWVQLVLMVYVPIYILNAFVSFPFEWLVVILVRGLFEFTLAKPIRRGVSLLLTTLAWYFIAPRVGASSLLLNAIVHCYMVRQAAGLTDLPNPMGNMP